MKTLLITQISRDPMVLAKKIATLSPDYVLLISEQKDKAIKNSLSTVEYFKLKNKIKTSEIFKVTSFDNKIENSINALISFFQNRIPEIVTKNGIKTIIYDVTTGISFLNVLNNDTIKIVSKNIKTPFFSSYIQKNTHELLLYDSESNLEFFPINLGLLEDDLIFRKKIYGIDKFVGNLVYIENKKFDYNEEYLKLFFIFQVNNNVRILFNSFSELFKKERKKGVLPIVFKQQELQKHIQDKVDIKKLHLHKTSNMGYEFESLVLAKLFEYLKRKKETFKEISSIYKNLKIYDKGTQIAEYDIVIFYKNGKVIIIEAKSAKDVDKKDLTSRITVARNYLGNDLNWFTVFPLNKSDIISIENNVKDKRNFLFLLNAISWRGKIATWKNQRSGIKIIALDEIKKIFE